MKKLVWMLTTMLVFTACSKDDEPLIKDYLGGMWQLNQYLRNGIDETSNINISSYVEDYQAEGVFSRSYLDWEDSPVTETGKYVINEETKSVHLSDISSIDQFSEEHSTLSYSSVMVIKFNNSEMVYTFENGGASHEFRFIKK